MTSVAIRCQMDAVGCWVLFLLEGFMQSHRPYFFGQMTITIHLMLVASFCSGHACDDAALMVVIQPTYVHGTENNHVWFKLNFNAYFEHVIIISLQTRYYFYKTRMLNSIIHILIDFTYCMPDFVLTIIILTLSCLPLLNLGLQQELSTFL